MLRRTFVSTFIAIMIAVGAWGQDAGSSGHIQRSHEAPAAGSNYASLRAILDVLDKAKLSGTLELLGHCESLDVRIPLKWAPDTADVGRRRSEATLVEFYSIQAAHMESRKG